MKRIVLFSACLLLCGCAVVPLRMVCPADPPVDPCRERWDRVGFKLGVVVTNLDEVERRLAALEGKVK